MEGRKPSFLKQGDKVRIISTARKVSREELAPAVHVIQSWGLEVQLGAHLFCASNQFAGTDEERAMDFQMALDDPEIKAIFCARGGYGSPRIVDQIQWDGFLHSPKWIVGFSDVTVLLNTCYLQGICSLHAPMPLFYPRAEYSPSIEKLRDYLFGSSLLLKCGPTTLNKSGMAVGTLVGGNLSLIVNSIGTVSSFDSKGKILFLEDLDEYLYHVDRMFVQLKRAGILKGLSGLVIGHFSEMKDNEVPFGENAYEIIRRNVLEYDFPLAFGLPVGHAPQNMPMPIGAKLKLSVNSRGAVLDFS